LYSSSHRLRMGRWSYVEHPRTPDGCVTLAAVGLLTTSTPSRPSTAAAATWTRASAGPPSGSRAVRGQHGAAGGRGRRPCHQRLTGPIVPACLFENLRSVLPVVAELGRVAGVANAGHRRADPHRRPALRRRLLSRAPGTRHPRSRWARSGRDPRTPPRVRAEARDAQPGWPSRPIPLPLAGRRSPAAPLAPHAAMRKPAIPLATHLALTASQACTVGDRSLQAELAWPEPRQ
jgi:hypothetical protein